MKIASLLNHDAPKWVEGDSAQGRQHVNVIVQQEINKSLDLAATPPKKRRRLNTTEVRPSAPPSLPPRPAQNETSPHKRAPNDALTALILAAERQPVVDEIEVFLTYAVGLCDVLGLPVSTSSMLYVGVAGLKAIDLAHATVAKSKQLTAYLAASSLSQQHLRRLAAADWSYTALTPRKLAASIDIEGARCRLTLERYADLRQALAWLQGQV